MVRITWTERVFITEVLEKIATVMKRTFRNREMRLKFLKMKTESLVKLTFTRQIEGKRSRVINLLNEFV